MTGGRQAFGGYMAMSDWTHTPVGYVLPVEAPIRESGPASRVRILKWKNRIIASLPWSKIGEYGVFYGFNTVVERKGSEVLAELVAEPGAPLGNKYLRNPFLVWWDIGQGRSFAMTSGWTPANAGAFVKWDYYPDYAVNLILFIADLPVPADPALVHRIRSRLNQYYLTRDFVISMIEFIDHFGANPRSIEELLGGADQELKQVNSLYLNYDFEASLAKVDEVTAKLGEATRLAPKLKDQALFWVYVVEWSAVTGTLMFTGILVWTLMMKRRLYRAVATTTTSHR